MLVYRNVHICRCLRTVLKDNFPTKPVKVPSVQIPGLLDANVAAGAKEPVINMARNTVADSLVSTAKIVRSKNHYMTADISLNMCRRALIQPPR